MSIEERKYGLKIVGSCADKIKVIELQCQTVFDRPSKSIRLISKYDIDDEHPRFIEVSKEEFLEGIEETEKELAI